jgi:hypothetical protein
VILEQIGVKVAELLIKATKGFPDFRRYQDGDVVCAFNQNHIKLKHAFHICSPLNFNLNKWRLRPDGLLRFFCDKTFKYRFERISKTEVKRTNLNTNNEEIFSDKSNLKGEYIYVQQHINYMKKNANHYIFGRAGEEIWYGGERNFSNDVVSSIWEEIEKETPYKEVDFYFWPLGKEEKKHFLALSVNDFSDFEANQWIKPSFNENNEIIRVREYFVDWRILSLPVKEKDIKNLHAPIDIRKDIQLNTDLIVERKDG